MGSTRAGFIGSAGMPDRRGLHRSTGRRAPVHSGPGCGGSGCAGFHSVSFGASLANPFPELPEVVRLGWLIAQLGLLQTLGTGESCGRRHDNLVQPALLPAVLIAGAEVELVRPAESLEAGLARAMKSWRVDGIESD